MSAKHPRELDLPLSFLGTKSYAARIWKDALDAEANPNHLAVESLSLPAGQRVELKPGGYHVMLEGLARPLAAGDKVPLTFTIEDRSGKRTTLEVKAEVRPLGQ